MPSPKPIRSYLQAMELHQKGAKEGASQKLAEALGVHEASNILVNSIDELLASNSLSNNAVLQVLATEVAKGKSGKEENND